MTEDVVTATGSHHPCKQLKSQVGDGGVGGFPSWGRGIREEMAGTRKVFPTKFVWDHGGSEVCLAINGGPPVKLQKEEDGTFEVTDNCLQVS